MKFIATRLLQAIPTVFLVTIFVFMLLHLAPGDPINSLVAPGVPPEVIELVRKRYGLDQPLPVQYLNWLENALRGQFGESIRTGRVVSRQVGYHYKNTLILTVAAMVINLAIGFPLGVIAAVRRGGLTDLASMLVAVAGQSVPPFWFALMLVMVFAVRLGWFPAIGSGTVRHLVLPALALGLPATALTTRMVRSALIEVLSKGYVRVARAKGLAESVVLLRHALRTALIPVTTAIGLQFGVLMAGAVVTEVVFSWPGIGWLLVNSVAARDFPVVQAGLLAVSMTFILSNLVVDILVAYLDPRIRYDQ